ncbi:DUF4238 domain-containing protein, partial [Deltaproteobacteria bacterium OttesenSCG-928-M10]|nr:DUF4238 domain-containing protein [Deltaproteobacteria bacterium OttesenSCG-928-M10]
LLKMIYRIHHVLADIDICLIKNATTVDFVVTDAIASRYNFYLERRKKEFMGYRASFSAIGLVLCIPITPRLLLLGFDSEAYYLLGNVIKNRADAHAINEIQYLNSYTNIYYKSETSEKNIDKYDDQLASQKPSQRVITSSFKEDKKTETGIFYKPVNEEDSMSSEPIVYVSSQANTDANIGFELLNEKSAVWNPQVNRLATRPHVQKLENIPRSSLRADPSIIWE